MSAMATAAHSTTRTTDVRSALAEPELLICGSVIVAEKAER